MCCHENRPESIHSENFPETKPAEREELSSRVCSPREQTQTRGGPSALLPVSQQLSPQTLQHFSAQKNENLSGECCCLQHTNYIVLPPVAQWPAASCDSCGPTGTNSVPAHMLKKEPVVADLPASDPKSLKLQ